MRREIENILYREGYRFSHARPEEVGIFYKYYEEGFHVIIAVDLEQGYHMTKAQHEVIETKAMSLFYHPQGKLADFPDGFPVYHVEVLTLLIGGSSESVRMLCSECSNMWSYHPTEQRLIVYENQPGDFWGLRSALESISHMEPNRSDKIKVPKSMNCEINKLPYITIGITVMNVIVYLILEMMGDTENGLFIASHGGMYPEFIRYNHQWWRIITSMFIHFGMVHLVNNMVIFCCVGSRLERAVGHCRMLAIYSISGVGGGLLSYAVMLASGNYAVSAGASGAVFGTIGGLLWAVIWNRGRFEGLTTRGLVLMIALSLYYGFSTIGVDNWCHIGGILTGFAVTATLYHRKRQKC